MKIKINEDGYLEVKRKNNFKKVECPFALDFTQETLTNNGYEPYLKGYIKDYRYCGDWCSQFKEPEKFGEIVSLQICRIEYDIIKKKFEDLRGD